MSVIYLKQKEFKDALKFANDALEIDHKYIKALFLKGRALVQMTEYTQAIETFKDLLEFDPDNEEGKKELIKTEAAYKNYQDKETKMFKKMF